METKMPASQEQDFAELFAGRNDLRLVIMNSCQSAATSASNEISGIAYEIIEQGVPAVVAMQYAIADDTVILFSREFYRTPANKHSVDFAMAHTRAAILANHRENWPRVFGIPVLFMRSEDGVIL